LNNPAPLEAPDFLTGDAIAGEPSPVLEYADNDLSPIESTGQQIDVAGQMGNLPEESKRFFPD
jgi:hypothetical protein